MIHKITTFIFRIIAGANITTILLMLLIGYSDRLNPISHPTLSTVGLGFPIILAINLAFLVFWVVFKFRWSFIPIIGLIVCFGPIRTYVPLNLKSEVPDGAIKVLSYNVCHFSTWKDKKEPHPIFTYLAEQDADIVCMQESGKKYIGRKEIEKQLGNLYQYSDTSEWRNGGDVLCILSKYPILKKEVIKYETNNNHSAAFHLLIDGDTVIVINNHLASNQLSQEERKNFSAMVKGKMEQDSARQESIRLIDKLASASARRATETDSVAKYIQDRLDRSIILCGDLNDNPISYTHYRLTQHLQDCFVKSGRGFGFSYYHHSMRVRIDNILASSDWTPYGCYVDSKNNLSDHHPIISWLKKSPKP